MDRDQKAAIAVFVLFTAASAILKPAGVPYALGLQLGIAGAAAVIAVIGWCIYAGDYREDGITARIATAMALGAALPAVWGLL